MLIPVEGTGTHQLGTAEYGGCCSLVTLFFGKKKLTGVLEHCREGETNCWFSIFCCFLLTASLRRRMSVYICLFTIQLL